MSSGVQSCSLSHLRHQRISNHTRILYRHGRRFYPFKVFASRVPRPAYLFFRNRLNRPFFFRDGRRNKRSSANHGVDAWTGRPFSNLNTRRIENREIHRHPLRQAVGEQTQDQ